MSSSARILLSSSILAMMRSISAECEVGPDIPDTEPTIPETDPELLVAEETGAGDDVTVMADEKKCPAMGGAIAEALREGVTEAKPVGGVERNDREVG